MLRSLSPYLKHPALYAKSSHPFWEDKHISKGMLEEHLNPTSDGATRNHQFVAQSAAWIAQTFPVKTYPALLDLGCGPGIYAEKFAIAGYDVTGIDLSMRSIDFAQQHIENKSYRVRYICQDYLQMTYEDAFDLVTLIWCDYGALPPEDRHALLKNIHRALKPGGVLVFDVFTKQRYHAIPDKRDYEYYPTGGFWYPDEHLCLHSTHHFDGSIILNQTILLTHEEPRCYNIWERYFTKDEILEEVQQAGFSDVDFYGDISGQDDHIDNEIICIAAHKERRRTHVNSKKND